jgi:hypothetical protein
MWPLVSGEDAPRPYLENLIVLEIKTNKQTNTKEAHCNMCMHLHAQGCALTAPTSSQSPDMSVSMISRTLGVGGDARVSCPCDVVDCALTTDAGAALLCCSCAARPVLVLLPSTPALTANANAATAHVRINIVTFVLRGNQHPRVAAASRAVGCLTLSSELHHAVAKARCESSYYNS